MNARTKNFILNLTKYSIFGGTIFIFVAIVLLHFGIANEDILLIITKVVLGWLLLMMGTLIFGIVNLSGGL